jgi:hypothetical protein
VKRARKPARPTPSLRTERPASEPLEIVRTLFAPAVDDGWMLVLAGSQRFAPDDGARVFELLDAVVLQLIESGVVSRPDATAALEKLSAFMSGRPN